MSVQSEFLKSLFDELIARGVNEEAARENVTKFQSQLKKKAEVDGNEKIESALSKIPPASVAENIYNMLKAESDDDAGARSEVVVIDTESDTVIKTVKEGKEAATPITSDAEDTPEEAEESEETAEVEAEAETEAETKVEDEADVEDEAEENSDGEDKAEDTPALIAAEADVAEPVTEEASEEAAEETNEAEAEDEAEAEVEVEAEEKGEEENAEEEVSDDGELDALFGGEKEEADFSEEEEEEEENDDDLKVFQLPGEDDDLKDYEPGSRRRVHSAGVHSAAQTPPGQRKTVRRTTESIDLFDGEDVKKSNWLFYVFAIILVPIVAVLGAILFTVVLGLWLVLAVVSTVLIVAVFGISAVGALASLLGIIYGFIELIGGNIPAAMFEIGLALTVGSAVLFVGIIIYNVAVRFVPFVIKKLGVLLVLIFKLFGKAFRRFKKLCASI